MTIILAQGRGGGGGGGSGVRVHRELYEVIGDLQAQARVRVKTQ